ncbi:lactonase family protein [Tessaracoccus antarcticus]|nr:beta-propeller fold lactonase family protein [Tessaracoccus antarcticus]
MTTPSVVLVGNDKGGDISAFRLIDDELRLLASTQVGVGCSTFAVDVDRALVYVGVKDPHPAVVTLQLDRDTGALSELSRRDVDDPLAYLGLSGSTLLGASYHGGWGASWPVVDGVLGDVVSRLEFRNLHAAVPGRDGRTAYFASLGEDLIAQYALHPDSSLTELPEATVACPPGSGPRHLVLTDDGRSAYLITEFTGEAIRFDRAADGSLTRAEAVAAHATDKGLGVSAYGRDPRADHLIWGADLGLADGGRWLVCSERTESTIAAVALDGNGHLTDRVVITGTEEQPRGLAVSPEGTRLVVVGERSGCASLYRLDEGALVHLHRVETGLGPDWVRFI